MGFLPSSISNLSVRTLLVLTSLSEKPFIAHIAELRKRFFFCLISVVLFSIVGFFLYAFFIEWLSYPFRLLIDVEKPLYITHLLEGFVTKLKSSLLLGFIFSIPMFIFHFIRFAFPGFRAHEKRFVGLLLFFGLLLSFFAFYLCYFHILPYSIAFLTSRQFVPTDVGLLLSFTDNIFYVFQFLFYSVLLFQFPIVIFLLLYYQLVSYQTLIQLGRFFVIGIVVLSAIITPPDLISQLAICVPLISLYYFVILIAKVCGFKQKRVAADV